MSNEQNPYEVLNVDTEPPGTAPKPPNWFRVEGDILVCGESVVLPERCVFTGSIQDLSERNCEAQFPSFRLVVFQRTCKIKYFVSKAEVKRKRKTSVLTIGCFIFNGLLVSAGFATRSGIVILVGIALTKGSRPPRVASGSFRCDPQR